MKLTQITFIALAFSLTACNNQPKPETNASPKPKPIAQKERATIKQHEELVLTEDKSMAAPSASNKTMMVGMPSPIQPAIHSEKYAKINHNAVQLTSENPISTFSIDVDTGAYANVRRFLNQGQFPNPNAVRSEELINYFDYNYAASDILKTPFSLNTEIAPTPWNKDTHLLHIGIKGYQPKYKELPAANLVFLLDVSGSMNSPNKLGLLKSSLKLLTKQMREKDTVAIVVYAGAAGEVLKPTKGNETAIITNALNRLKAGGSTHGSAGIQLAYELAQKSFVKDGINRVILATDGDFNVGTTDFESLKQMVENKRKSGIALTTLGFGQGNYNDHLMEQLADAGNGNYAYIDNLNEAKKVLVDELHATLLTIAKDVKIQIEFNPAVVAEYRLIGYENRQLKREDFKNDKVDAGEIGAGHSVTALYDISLQNSQGKRMNPLRYGKKIAYDPNAKELAFLRLRYKEPNAEVSQLIEQPILVSDIQKTIHNTSDNYRFSAAVAAFAQKLSNDKYLKTFSYDSIADLAQKSKGKDEHGLRSEFIQLVKLASALAS